MNHGVNAWIQRFPSCLIGLAALAMLLLEPGVAHRVALLSGGKMRPRFLYADLRGEA